MSRRIYESTKLAPLLLALVATGCSLLSAPEVTPTRYFVLTSDRTTSLSEGTDSRPEISIGVGPFTFPSYLERPQMVRRTDPNQIAFSQFNRWAEPVASGFLRVLSEDVAHEVGTNQVVLFPWYEIPLEYQVKGEILRFEANDEGEAVLECIWTIYRLQDKEYVLTRHADLSRPVSSGDPDEIAAALSKLVTELGIEIGRALKSVHRGRRG